jgi:hypothetical protein
MLVSICLALALTSTSFGVVAGNWETSAEGWVSGTAAGWNSGGANVSIVPGQPVGATLDSASLGAVSDIGGWAWLAVVATWNGGVTFSGADARDNTNLSFDATTLAADWADCSWYQLVATIQIQYEGDIWMNLPQVYSASWSPMSGDYTAHFDIDYSSVAFPESNVWNCQIALGCNNNAGAGSPMLVTYLDNVQLTPEPATLALLGLGGLALIRRKR